MATSTASIIAHVNFPHYGNVGDSAIWLAEEAMIAARGNVYKVRLPTFAAAERFFQRNGAEAVTVILPGGGSFGSLWPYEHERRLRLMERFTTATFVQMPQSIHFFDDLLLRRTQDALRKVRHFTLFVRDRASLEFARLHLKCEVQLVPDSAFFLELAMPETVNRQRIHIIRGDREGRATDLHTSLDRYWTKDSKPIRRLTKCARWVSRVCPRTSLESMLYRRIADARLLKGVDLLASGQGIITDRLHAHILCVLLGIPHVIVDTEQGKIRNFLETWTGDVSYCTMVHDISRADAAMDNLLSSLA